MEKLENQKRNQFIRKEEKTHTTLNSNFQLLTSKSGITLIALVVTIVVLLILAGITINLVLADGGIFGKANEAVIAQKLGEYKDKIEIAKMAVLLDKDNLGEVPMDKFLEELKNQGIIKEESQIKTDEQTGIVTITPEEGIEIQIKPELDENGNSTGNVGEIIYPTVEDIIAGGGTSGGGSTGGDSGNTGGSTTVAETGISLDKTTANITQGDSVTLTATVEPNDATNKSVTWTSSAPTVATVSSSSGTSGTPITVTGIKVGSTTITATTSNGIKATCEITVKEKEPTISGTNGTDGTSHTATTLTYTWEEMNTIAKVISDNFGTGENQVNKATEEVTVTANGKSYTVGVGDTIELTDTSSTSYTVRILGFNHDKLTNPKAYNSEETKTTVYAGISFEFVSFLTGTTYKQMNTIATNANGWAATQMRKDLNGYTTADAAQSGDIAGLGATLTNSTYIKQVEKNYIATYKTASSVTTSSDYLWLLSTSEIWNNGYTTGAYGFAITGANESTMYDTNDTQTQYKYYAKNLGSTAYRTQSDITKKPSTSSPHHWWLRSPFYNVYSNFCIVVYYGYCGDLGAGNSSGVAPGFSI